MRISSPVKRPLALLPLSLLLVGVCHAYSPRLLWTRPLNPGQTVEGHDGWLIVRPPLSYSEGNNRPGIVLIADPPADGSPAPAEGTQIRGRPWDLTVIRPDTGEVAAQLHGCYSAFRGSGNTLLAAREVGALKSVVEAWDLNTGKLTFHVSAQPPSDPRQGLTLSEVVGGRFHFGDAKGIHLCDLRRGQVVRSWPPLRDCVGGESADARFAVSDRFYYNDGHSIGITRMADYPHGWWYSYATEIALADEDGVIGVGGYFRTIVSLSPRGRLYFDSRPWRGDLFWTVEYPITPAHLSGRSVVLRADLFRDIPIPNAKPGERDRMLHELSQYLVAFDRFTGRVPWKVPMLADSYAVCPDKIAVMAGHRRGDDIEHRLEVYDLRGHRLWRGSQTWGEDRPLVVPAGQCFALAAPPELRCYR